MSFMHQLWNEDANTVLLSSDLSLFSHNLANPQQRLSFTNDRLFMFSPVFLFQKTSPLTNTFSKEIQMLWEFGIIDHWIKEHTDKRKPSTQIEPSKLELENILAIFLFCGGLLSVSFIVFILEIACTKSTRIQAILECFTY